ncbi:homoserine O-acetyltransferase [Coemansia sp. RSA 989]|nr:homoserine O-acetyltransferase [Coemansia sp. RSA 1086]KAJ1751923.1 homoserine O-acetyltransferase [Coemansia sp. RSA 1821]KAJ1866628.1 homoserine O-acetyltransferase [Coemansia sp. RSA 989]KAJ1872089.1 homoserine O-acetyltransferase [Coemansia sp. RSA 990]KAJ2648484.1 homoserine O-acetyltransferase [Coemansia sp. RSA 1250]KAJ2670331.1 homoserine O-acetyltransferase [Coemansia sp. RSA 1085]
MPRLAGLRMLATVGRAQMASRRLLSSAKSNPPMSFPCIDRLESRQRDLMAGPEPTYEKVVTGYSLYKHKQPFVCDHGGVLPQFDIAYETWGTLNSDRSNAIMVHTGLSGSSHAHSHDKNLKPGWWEKFIGPGRALDTDKFFVICTNVLGGCYGSTGPGSVDPRTGERYATTFPLLTVNDMVRAQFHLLDSMGISRLYASVGASMGGMQSLCAAALFPERVGRLVSISACARSHPYSIALRFAQRQALMADPNFNRGFYYDGVQPHVGMKLARAVATVTYRSGPEWELRFGRRRRAPEQPPALCPDFLIETYLDHQSERFCLQYDANSLLYVSKAMDMFDISQSVTQRLQAQREQAAASTETPPAGTVCMHVNEQEAAGEVSRAETSDEIMEDLVAGVKNAQQPALILGVQSDILFPVKQQKEIADILRRAGNSKVTYYELDALYGHDTFLIDVVNVGAAIKGHLENA